MSELLPIDRLMSAFPEESKATPGLVNSNNSNGSGRNLDALLASADRMGWTIKGPITTTEGCEYHFKKCPFQTEFDGKAGIIQKSNGEFGFNCFCGDHPKKTIRDLFDLAGLAAHPRQTQTDRRVIQSIEEIPAIEKFAFGSIEWAVNQIIAMSAVNLLTGDAGCGKSTLAAAIAYKVSIGGEFLGRICQQRPVLVLDCENSHPVVLERFQRLRAKTGERLRYWGPWLPEEPPPAASTMIMEWVIKTNPKPLIIVDSLVGFHPGAENDSTETRKYMDQFRRLATLGAGVLVLHHVGKSETSKDYRGSSDIKASIDVGLHLSNLTESGRLGTMRLRVFKARFSVEGNLLFRYFDGDFGLDERETTATVTESLVELLKANPGIPSAKFQQLATDKGLRRKRARDFVNNGIDHKPISVINGKNNTQRLTWSGGHENDADSLF